MLTQTKIESAVPRKFGLVKRILHRTLLRPISATILAAIGIFGGVSALFIGLLCVVIHGLVASDRSFDRVGTVLLIIAIPLILIGSVFLDEVGGNQ